MQFNPKKLKKTRQMAEMSCEQAGRMLNPPKGKSAVSKHERGDVSPTISPLEQYAIIYRCGVEDFFDGVPEGKEAMLDDSITRDALTTIFEQNKMLREKDAEIKRLQNLLYGAEIKKKTNKVIWHPMLRPGHGRIVLDDRGMILDYTHTSDYHAFFNPENLKNRWLLDLKPILPKSFNLQMSALDSLATGATQKVPYTINATDPIQRIGVVHPIDQYHAEIKTYSLR